MTSFDPQTPAVYHRRRGPLFTEATHMSKEQRADQIRALITERAGYEVRGLDDRVAAVDAELKRLGHAAKKPQARAEKRSSKAAEKR